MKKTTKILLIISLTAFALGCTNLLGGIGAPLGAVFFGLFLIFRMLENEMVLFDDEQKRRIAMAANYPEAVPIGSKKATPAEGKVTALTLSHSS
jgi:hypothetical protein